MSDVAEGTCPKGCHGDFLFTDARNVTLLIHVGEDGKPIGKKPQVVPTPERAPTPPPASLSLNDAKARVLSIAAWRMSLCAHDFPTLRAALESGKRRDREFPDAAYDDLLAGLPADPPRPETSSESREREPDTEESHRRLVAGTPDEKRPPGFLKPRST